MGAIPWATLVFPISTTCIHEVYDDKKYMQSIGVYTGTYPWKSVSLFESTSVLAQFYYCLALSYYATMFQTIE